MQFTELKVLLQQNFKEITKDSTHLFEVDVDIERLWNYYLDSYPEGTNEIFREKREYDCSCCRQFVKTIGNTVTIKNGEIKTIWDFEVDNDKYNTVLKSMSSYVKSKAIKDVWINKENRIGHEKNFEKLEDGKVIEWSHFALELPRELVYDNVVNSEAEIKGGLRDTRNVFKRSLDEISEDSVSTVLELIYQNSLYKGEEWKSVLNEFLKYNREYMKLDDNDKEIYAWENSVKVGGVIGRIRNHSIGTLLLNISEGVDLDLAVKKYEKIVAPESYKRSKPIYSKKMLEEAKQKIQDLGYMESLSRRHATLDDITVNNILFSNKDASKRIGAIDIFEEMSKSLSVDTKKFSRVDEISIDDFVNDVLPTAKEVEVFLENKHQSNMVSLIAPVNKDSKTMFKWENNFSWAYSGNITDSSMKDRVKSAGGNVEGELRFSIQWNDEDYNGNDFDAHCIEPRGNEIFWRNKLNSITTGRLDVDIMSPRREVPAVENITWLNRSRMQEGRYLFFVNNFSHNGGRAGFKAEIEFDRQVFTFEYDKELRQGEKVQVAEVYFDGISFTIKELLPSTTTTRDAWGLQTNQFVPVSVVMNSPNHWTGNEVGNKHFFFMLKDSINPEQPNSFFNEFLKQELTEHKRVFEALGAKMAVKEVDEQLSGIGFSSTKRDEVLIKVIGKTERVLRVKI